MTEKFQNRTELFKYHSFDTSSQPMNVTTLISILVSSNIPLIRGELTKGWESLHYLDNSTISVLEIETSTPGLVSTKVDWLRN